MTKVNFNLPIFNLYEHGPLKINQHEVPVEIRLTKGNHTFTSEPIEIGNFFHYKIFAYISIPYSYDPNMKYITIAGPEDTSVMQLSIHTSPDKIPELSDTHRLNSKEFTFPTNIWSDFINRSTDLRQVGKTTIRLAIETLVNELLNAGVQGVIQTGDAPIVTPDNYQAYKDMFLPQKADVQKPSLEDILQLQAAIKSTYYGTITWNSMYSFANIIGSTHDPKPSGYSSWLTLWKDTCNNGNYPTRCSSYNYSNGAPGFSCGSDFVGGHVIPGTKANSVTIGGTAYIFPICKGHNNNDNIYMSCRYNPKGVVIKNYNQKMFLI